MSKKSETKTMISPPSSFYRRIAFSFIGAAVVLLAVVFYYSFAKVTIIIKPKQEALSASLSVAVSAEPQERDTLGMVTSVVLERESRFPVSGEGETVETQARGTVTIKNATGRDQPLVRTTRLLAPDGKLFRIDKTVLAPAGGSVEVEAYADEPGVAGEIGPTRFTVPGLWEGLQDKIYAESTAAFCCGAKTLRVLTDEDLRAAGQMLETELMNEARERLRSELASRNLGQNMGGEIFLPEILERASDAEPGSEAAEFSVALKLGVTGVFYDSIALNKRVAEVLRGLSGVGEALVEVDPERMNIIVESYDVEEGRARLAVEATGLLALRPDSEILEKGRLVGLDRAALKSYFEAWQSIESVQIEFRPAWLRRVPRLKDHIEIKIQE